MPRRSSTNKQTATATSAGNGSIKDDEPYTATVVACEIKAECNLAMMHGLDLVDIDLVRKEVASFGKTNTITPKILHFSSEMEHPTWLEASAGTAECCLEAVKLVWLRDKETGTSKLYLGVKGSDEKHIAQALASLEPKTRKRKRSQDEVAWLDRELGLDRMDIGDIVVATCLVVSVQISEGEFHHFALDFAQKFGKLKFEATRLDLTDARILDACSHKIDCPTIAANLLDEAMNLIVVPESELGCTRVEISGAPGYPHSVHFSDLVWGHAAVASRAPLITALLQDLDEELTCPYQPSLDVFAHTELHVLATTPVHSNQRPPGGKNRWRIVIKILGCLAFHQGKGTPHPAKYGSRDIADPSSLLKMFSAQPFAILVIVSDIHGFCKERTWHQKCSSGTNAVEVTITCWGEEISMDMSGEDFCRDGSEVLYKTVASVTKTLSTAKLVSISSQETVLAKARLTQSELQRQIHYPLRARLDETASGGSES